MDLERYTVASATPEEVAARLQRDGIVVLPGFVPGPALAQMRRVFTARLGNLCWNDRPGFVMTERYRQMIPDVLTLAQGFVDLGVHPLVAEVARRCVGDGVQLTEAKGWRSTVTRRDFHGWHFDRWYHEDKVSARPTEIKLATYLSDVASGAFAYAPGSHRVDPATRAVGRYAARAPQDWVEVPGAAGTSILFDTAGTHRQTCPVLEPRDALFYNYHDPAVPVQDEDVHAYRYHPLLLNAAFLGELDAEQQRLLGFGDVRRLQADYVRRARHPWVEGANRIGFEVALRVGEANAWTRDKLAGVRRRLAHVVGGR